MMYEYSSSSSNSSSRCGSRENRIGNLAQTTCRTPLIIVTLYIPSEAKTLAPKCIKRDHRRPPSFCQNFQKQIPIGGDQCSCKVNATPNLFIRGREINENSLKPMETNAKNATNEIHIDDNDGNGETDEDNENVSCCACFIEMERQNSNLTVPTTKQTEFFVNYRMDSNGDLPTEPVIPICDDIGIDSDASSVTTKRICSPSTSQIIRITMNNKHPDSLGKDDE